MKKPYLKILHLILWVATAISFCIPGSILAAGLLTPKNGESKDVRMKSHHVDVTLNNGFARTEVDQVFINTGDRDLEAVYSFPVPKQASLSELSLWIDGQEVIGEVLEKEKARAVYENQAAKGNDTAIAEKNSFETFEVSVSPVRANTEMRVKLVYYQPIEIDLNIGRYVYPLEEGNVNEERIMFWEVDTAVNESFQFDLTLKSAFPVKDVRFPGYEDRAVIQKILSDAEANSDIYTVNMDFPNGGNLSKDIVCYYRLDDDTPARVELIPYRSSDDDGTFMVVVTPGSALQRITQGTDWTFVLDVSGSMSGNKIATLSSGVVKTIKKMTPEDRFRIITFSDRAQDYSGGYLQASEENINRMIANIKNLNTGGSTALFAGLEMAYKGIDHDRINGIILVTDGVANDGPSRNIDILDLHRKYDIRLFTFVIGNSANQPLLDSLARESGGFSMNISNSDDIIGRILQAKAKLIHECLYDTALKFSGETVKDLTPVVLGNLYKGQQIVVFGKYARPGEVTIELTGDIAGESKSWKCKAVLPETDTDNPEIERLWALSAIKDIMNVIQDEGEKNNLTGKVVTLGTEYSLVTDYTSMVVADDQAMEELAIDRKNAKRTNKERQAQSTRKSQPVKNYRVDNPGSDASASGTDNSMFKGSKSPGVGSGPVGPLFVAVAYWMTRKRKRG